jgi:HD-GYP domain-containing protein (c-di-GMP phosphodiesterase class II)
MDGLGADDTDAIRRMASALYRRDRATAEHAARVARFVRTLAEGLGFPEADVAVFETAAMLHDLGKIAVPDAILNKPGALTLEERALVRVHAAIGGDMVGVSDSLGPIAAMVRHHHERMDGNGYPDRLHGERIPIGARLIAVADSFDAIVSDRPYRRARGMDAALAELERHAGTQFDGPIVACFVDLARRGRIALPAHAFVA